MRNTFKKALSLALVLTLAVALIPAMGMAQAADVGETTTFIFAPRLFTVAELTGTGNSSMPSGYDKGFLFDYLDAGDSAYAPEYYRNWKLFKTNWRSDNTTDMANADVHSQQGLYFRYGSGSGWIAMKVRGFDAGTYNIKIKSYPLKGRNIALYVLDNATYGNADVATISNAIKNYASLDGVEKIGNADFYGKAGKASAKLYDSIYSKTTDPGYYCINTSLAEAEFGNVTFTGTNATEYIFVFKDEGEGVLDGKETASSAEKYFSIAALSFTPVAAAKNATVFGDKAAFIENTENGESWLYLVSALNSLSYNEAGFKFTVGDGEEQTVKTETVHRTITLDGDKGTYTAADFGLTAGNYLFITKTKLDAFSGQTIKFKPYAVSGTNEIEGSTYQAEIKAN